VIMVVLSQHANLVWARRVHVGCTELAFFLQDSAVSGTFLGPMGEPDMLQSRPVTLPGRGMMEKDSNYLLLLTSNGGV